MDRKDKRPRKIEGQDTSGPDFRSNIDCEGDMENESAGIRLGSSSVPKAPRPPEPAPDHHGDTDEEAYGEGQDPSKYVTEEEVKDRQRNGLTLGTTGTTVCEKETDGDTDEDPNKFFSKVEVKKMIDEAEEDCEPKIVDVTPTAEEPTTLSYDGLDPNLVLESTPWTEVSSSDDFESKILRGTPQTEVSTTESSSDNSCDSDLGDATQWAEDWTTESGSETWETKILGGGPRLEVSTPEPSSDVDSEPKIVEAKPRAVAYTTDGLAGSEDYTTESSSEDWAAEILGGTTGPRPDYEELFDARPGLPPPGAVKDLVSFENWGLSDWSADDDLPSNVAYDKESQTLLGGDAWVATLPETLHLACLTFPIRKDGLPTLVRLDRPVFFEKVWRPKHDIYVGCINVTNVSKHCVAYKIVPADGMKLIPEVPSGLIEYGQSKSLVVYTSMDVPYTFYDIKNEVIKLLAVPVVLLGKKGLTLDGWDKVEDKHLNSFWNFYKTDWLPHAEIQEIDGFQPQEYKYTLEAGYAESKIWGPRTKLGRTLVWLKSTFWDHEEEMEFLAYRSYAKLYPYGTLDRGIGKQEDEVKRTAFERQLLGIPEVDQEFNWTKSMKKLIKLAVYSFLLIYVFTKFPPGKWTPKELIGQVMQNGSGLRKVFEFLKTFWSSVEEV